MRAALEPEDIESIAQAVVEKLRPLLNTSNDDRYMTMRQLANYLGIGYSTVANNKKYLPHTYLNSTPLFKKSEIDAFLEQYKVKPTKNQRFIELLNGKR